MSTKQKFIRHPCGGLTKRQLAVIDELFKGELDEQAILDKYKVSQNLYQKWLADKNFADELDRRIDSFSRQSSILLARYAPLAAAKLISLTSCDKEEVVRKTCLDILSFLDARDSTIRRPQAEIPDARSSIQDARNTIPDARSGLNDQTAPRLSSGQAGRLLAALAEDTTENQT